MLTTVVMPIFSLIEYSDKNSKTSPSLWQYYSDKPAVNDDSITADFSDNSASFKFKEKITGQAGNDDTKHLEIAAATPINQKPAFSITDKKLFVLVVSLSTNDSAKLLQKLKSGLKPTINWNKYQSKRTMEAWNRYLDYLIGPSFQGANSLFESNTYRRTYTRYFFPTIEVKYCKFIINGKKLFWPTSKKWTKNIW